MVPAPSALVAVSTGAWVVVVRDVFGVQVLLLDEL